MKRARDNLRLDVSTGFDCNNRCIFCMEAGRRKVRAQRRERVTLAVVRALLRGHDGRDQVMFTSGEPTLHPLLPDFIGAARDEGYRTITLTTNGRRLAYAPYARELVARGLNHVVVSVHGADAPHHDSQTRSPGSFAQSAGALAVLGGLKASFLLAIHTNTVVSRRNLGRLVEIYRALAAHPVDTIVFNVLKPEGDGAAHFARLFPRFSDVRAAFDDLLALEPGAAARVLLLDMPRCCTAGLPARVRGYVLRYRYFEAEDDAPGRAQDAMVLGSTAGGRLMASDRRRANVPATYGPPCARCAARGRCDGVWTAYADRHGWGEFRPIAPRRRAGRRPR